MNSTFQPNSLEATDHSAIKSIDELAACVSYSLMDQLNADPKGRADGWDHEPREVLSGHFVPVKPTPLQTPVYVSHSQALFSELGFDNELAESASFLRLFSGDLSGLPPPMRDTGWACGYALSIYGTEYYRQCPFHTGNGYGDGRAISILEITRGGKRWEMQLKGAGPTPYCRGGDGRAVLRSSVREFLAQEAMHALNIPTSRSLSLIVSEQDRVVRPWYSENSQSYDPDIRVYDPCAISTRVASSFLRVGQIELFARRARKQEHPEAMCELELIVRHAIEREYANEIDTAAPLPEQVVALARAYGLRLAKLVAHWMRVGFCQGNFNSDNCAMGGFTLDYGPFGFMETFDPYYQPWTGGGRHFSFFNQPAAAEQNFKMLWSALNTLLTDDPAAQAVLEEVCSEFPQVMQAELEAMWAAKLGLKSFDGDLFGDLMQLMFKSSVDYTIFFRELSKLPSDLATLKAAFYKDDASLDSPWSDWLTSWRERLFEQQGSSQEQLEAVSAAMLQVNPKYILREWHLAPAYQAAQEGDFSLVHELQALVANPYAEQSEALAHKFYRVKPDIYATMGGISHYSCSS